MDLLDFLKDYSPRQHESEIQMQCPYRELHSVDSRERRQAFLNLDKNLFHCFSCGTKSTAIRLLTVKMELPLSDAIDLVQFRFIEDELDDYETKESTDYTLVEHEPEYLIKKVVPEYFLDRGFPATLLNRFHIGMADVLGNDVICIPYFQDDKLVGVKYRYEGDGRHFWYSTNFKKGNYLYNKPIALDKIILVEGETDVWRSIMNGLPFAAGILGTNISKYHIKEIEKYEDTYIAFDNDLAGFMAKEKAYLKLRDVTNLWFMPYQANDPGECKKAEWMNGFHGATDYAVYSYEMSIALGKEYTDIQKLAKKQLKM